MLFVRQSQIIRLAASLLLAVLISSPALAVLSQTYATQEPIPTDSLVSVATSSGSSVVAADPDNQGRLLGVVVPDASSTAQPAQQVQVATDGIVDVLVSTAGGIIHPGDYIGVSSIQGVGQKVGPTSIRAIGTAQTAFDGTGAGLVTRTIPTPSGHQTVDVGQIQVAISILAFANVSGGTQQYVPNWLQGLTNSVAGKPVPAIRIIIAAILLIVAIISISVLLYAAIRNSIISIGRNPLSKSAVLRSLLEVGAMGAGILILSVIAMYFVIVI